MKLPGGKRKAAAILPALALLGNTPLAEAPLAPAGKWTVDYADSQCVLQRTFGTGEAAVTLGLRPTPFGDAKAEFVLLAPKSGGAMEGGKAVVTLSPPNRSIDANYQDFDLDVKSRMTKIWVDQGALANLGTATEIAFTTGKNPTLRVTPVGIARALAALQACEDNLLTSWDIDPKLLANVAILPQAIKPETWYSNDDYPAGALRAGAQGSVTIVFGIGINGRVSACRTVVSSKNTELDQTTCNLTVTRGRYAPATDKGGKPVATFASHTVVWTLTNSGPTR